MIDDPETLAHRISDRTAARADRDAMIAGFRTPIAVPAARSAELERRRGRDSSNSGTPPSRAGRAKPTAAARCQRQRSRRRVRDRTPGGPTGHPGGPLRRSDPPDRIADHSPAVGTGCGAAREAGMAARSLTFRSPARVPSPRIGPIGASVPPAA